MQVSDFDFPFDPALIADHPVEPRDRSRLFVVARHGGPYAHQHMDDLPALLRPGDLVVVNDTKVMPVRLMGRKRPGGGKADLVLVKELGRDSWEALLKGGSKPGQVIDLDGATLTVMGPGVLGTVVKLSCVQPIRELLKAIGHMPLPPYIKRLPQEADRTWYQTAFARVEGSVAAPTAGLHVTDALLSSLQTRGIDVATVTLHVGPGTFRPVKVTEVKDHTMFAERIELPDVTGLKIQRAREAGGRVVAIGTTVVRTLETAANADRTVRPYSGETNLFIVPGYHFRVVDALLTNFHLPRTTLLMLVSAFTGLERLKAAYKEAVQSRYRFYSYGDAMLIL